MPTGYGRLPIRMRVGDSDELVIGHVKLAESAHVDGHIPHHGMAQMLREAADRLDADAD